MSSEIFGNFSESDDTREYLVLSFSSAALSTQALWRNNSLSADFLANYWGTFFPAKDKKSPRQRSEIEDAVSYIANELLENAIKFSFNSEISIRIGLYLSQNELRFYVTNSVNPATVGKFKNHIMELLLGDPDELYISRLEKNADADMTGDSGLGFLTILNDYDAELAWKFEIVRQEPEIITVVTMVRLPVIRAEE